MIETEVGSVRVLAVLCNWNGGHYIGRCLDALARQTLSLYEIVVVDNGSCDGSPRWIQAHYPRVRLLQNPTNLGVAVGYNQGMESIECTYVLILNADVFVADDYVERGVQFLEARNDAGAVTGRFYEEATDREIGGGFFLSPQMRIRPCSSHGGYQEVFGTTAAAALFRSDALEQVRIGNNEVFDASYFAYGEDIDLSWRLQLAGWKIYCERTIFAHHLGSGSLNGRIRFFQKPAFFQRHTLKNRYLTVIKNLTAGLALRLLPSLFLFELILWPYLLLRQPFRFPYLMSCWIEVIRLLPTTLRKRSEIQHRRCGSSSYIRRFITGL